MLLTADGSIDCQDKPNEQERTVAHLHFCEAVTAFTILDVGGNFLLKGFTLFEDVTVCLTYLLCCLFEKVSIVKPLTSKSGNSETYLLCRGFKGMTPEELVCLQKYHSTTPPTRSLFNLSDIPADFLQQFKECSKQFMSYQRNMIESNLETFRNLPQAKKKELFQTKDYAVEYYMNNVAVNLGPISKEHRLVSEVYLDGTKLNTTAILNTDGKKGSNRRRQEVSHSEKMDNKSKTWFDRVVASELPPSSTSSQDQSVGDKLLAKMGFKPGEGLGKDGSGISEAIEVKQLEDGAGLGYSSNPVNTAIVSTPDQVTWFSHSPSHVTVRPVYGRPVAMVTNSRFVTVDTLEQLNEATTNSTVIRNPELASLAKSFHPYYAVASVPDLYRPVQVQLAELDRLTGVLTGSPDMTFCRHSTEHITGLHERWGFTEMMEDGGRCGLVMFDMSSPFEGLRSVTDKLMEGGNCVLYCNSVTDRLTVGVIYLLTCLFTSTALIKTRFCCPHTADLFVVCKGKSSPHSSLLESLAAVSNRLQNNDRTLLEIVPISQLFQNKFYKFVSCVAERACDDAVYTVVQLEKLAARGNFPTGKSNEFIMECMSLLQSL